MFLIKKLSTYLSIALIPDKEIRQIAKELWKHKYRLCGVAQTAIRKKIAFNSNNYTTVALGSSHCEACFNPAFFSSPSFNFGINSCDNFMMYEIYKNIIKKSDIKNVIVFYDVFSRGNDNTKRKDFNYLFLPLKYILGFEYKQEDKNIEQLCLKNEKKIAGKTDKKYNGYNPIQDGTDYNLLEERCKNHLKLFNRGDEDYLLLKLAKECKEDGKNFILVFSPAQRVYKDKMPDSDTLFNNITSKIAAITGLGREYNLYNTEIFEKDEYWLDMDHMNEKGAEVFTKHLSSLLKEDNLI